MIKCSYNQYKNDCSYIKKTKGKIHMNMKLFYNLTAWAYDLLDVIYFKQFGLEVVSIKHCDYSKVFRVKKERD